MPPKVAPQLLDPQEPRQIGPLSGGVFLDANCPPRAFYSLSRSRLVTTGTLPGLPTREASE